jgi:hypothetical protein
MKKIDKSRKHTVVTASPNRQYCDFLSPIIPPIAVPE